MIGRPTEEGHRLYLRVALDSGQEVRARVRGTQAVAGDRVVLSETRSRFGGVPRYRLVRVEAAR